MPQVMTKKAIEQIKVAERRKAREKHATSLFLRKTGNCFKGMVQRAKELGREQEIDFTLAELRMMLEKAMTQPCPWSGAKLTVSNLAVDHSTPISRGGNFGRFNLTAMTKSSNWQKGALTAEEFHSLLRTLDQMAPEAKTDTLRRLTIGGRWGFRK